METEFNLQINLGNEAMSSGSDIACALRKAADYVDGMGGLEALEKKDILRENIRDANGNAVGFFRIGPKMMSRA